MALIGNTLYLGGSFTLIGGERTGGGTPIDPVTAGIPTGFMPLGVGGDVYATAPDGSGGWYVAGQYQRPVLALAFDGTTLYAGGGLTMIGGVARSTPAAGQAVFGRVAHMNEGSSE